MARDPIVPTLKAKCPRGVRKTPGTVQSVPTLERRVLGGFGKVLGQYEVSQHLSEGS